MTSRTSWASCSRPQRLRRYWTRGRRKRRKVKSKLLKVKRHGRMFLQMMLTSWNKTAKGLFSCVFVTNRRSTHCKGPSSTRGGIHRYLPEIQILLQPVGVYPVKPLFFLFVIILLCYIVNSSIYFFTGASEINHLQPFIRGARSPRFQALGYGECVNLYVSSSLVAGGQHLLLLLLLTVNTRLVFYSSAV